MAAFPDTMVYADPRNDITNDVIFNLNRLYKAVANGPRQPTATAPARSSGRRPAG